MDVAENMIRWLGRYSEGYRLAAQHGPRSGLVLEHAYRNQPRGRGPIGRFIDRRFLHRSAWDGVRARLQLTQQLARDEIQRRRHSGRTTMLLDLASGTAGHLRELVRQYGGPDLEVVCRERDAKVVMHARELAAAEDSPVVFCVGDPTDPASYLSARDPDIVIAGGLLPAIRRDDVVRRVFRLVIRHTAPGGLFITTTVTDPTVRLSPWEDDLATAPTVRAASTIAAWLRATGFRDVEVHEFSPGGAALTARRPTDL